MGEGGGGGGVEKKQNPPPYSHVKCCNMDNLVQEVKDKTMTDLTQKREENSREVRGEKRSKTKQRETVFGSPYRQTAVNRQTDIVGQLKT